MKKKRKKKISKIILTAIKRKAYELDAESIAYYRRNPVIAAEDLLGVKLLDSQAIILQRSWNCPHVLWTCCRNFGKSFLGAIFIILKAILYENQAIYIVSSVGDQSKELFNKIEEIIKRIGKTSASIKSLTDIAEKEIVTSGSNKTGFSHNPSGYHVEFYNGSEIFTLNSNPDSARSRRATLVFFDEAAFCSDELISVCEAFATQNTEFATSTDDTYNPDSDKRKCPTQLVYASSQDTTNTLFYKYYKDFSKRMLAGDRDYFVCDMICDVAIKTFIKGKQYVPLLTKDKVDSAMKSNPTKAEREYYNKAINDGGKDQIVSWGAIRRNETFMLPELCWNPGSKYIIAFDPCRLNDNAIVLIGELYEDKQLGTCARIVNCINMIDKSTGNKYKLSLPEQRERLKKIVLRYNGHNADYEYIDSIQFDAGAGGQPFGIIDDMLADWTDDKGMKHRGFIDKTSEIYQSYIGRFPNAADKIRLISPKKYRTQMFQEFIELFDLGVIKLPHEYDGRDYIINRSIIDGEEVQEDYKLSNEEKVSLAEIDLLKNEITAMQKITNADKTSETYQLSKEAERKGYHDDRVYAMILLAHRLYELRHKNAVKRKDTDQQLTFMMFRQPKVYM